MQIVNLARAIFCNSGTSAYLLVLENQRFSRMSTHIIKVKNERAQFNLANANLNIKERANLKNKISDYRRYLENINRLNAMGR